MGTKLQIEIEADASKLNSVLGAVSSSLKGIGADADKTSISIKSIGDGSARAGGLGGLVAQAERLAQVGGPIGTVFSGVANQLDRMGVTGAAAMGGISAGATGLLVTLGVMTAAVAAVVAVFGGVFALSKKLVDMNRQWAEQVDSIQDATGMGAAYAAQLVDIAKIAGVPVDSLQQMVVAQARLFTEADAAIKKQGEERARVQAETVRRIESQESTSAARIASIQAAGSERLSDIAEQRAEKQAAILKDAERAARDQAQRIADAERVQTERVAEIRGDAARRIVDARNDQAQRITDITKREAEAEKQAAKSVDDLRADLDERRADRAKELSKRLAEIESGAAERVGEIAQANDERRAERADATGERIADLEKRQAGQRAALVEQFNNANGDLDRTAWAAEIAAFDQRAREELAKIQAEAEKRDAIDTAEADKRAAKVQAEAAKRAEQLKAEAAERASIEQREHDQRITEIGRRLSEERAAYAAQAAEIKAETIARIAEVQAATEDQTTRLGIEYARQTARSKAEYAERTADAKAAADQQLAALADAQQKITVETLKRIATEKEANREAMLDIGNQNQEALRRIEEGTPPAVKAVQALGLSYDELRTKSPVEQFDTLMTALGKVKNAQEQLTLQTQIFGRGGKDLTDIVEVYNKIVPPGAVAKLDELNGRVQTRVDNAINAARKERELGVATENAAASMGDKLSPALDKINEKLKELWEKHGPKVIAFIDNLLTNGLPAFITEIEKAATALDKVLTKIERIQKVGAFRAIDESVGPRLNAGAAAISGDLNGLGKALADWLNANAAKLGIPGSGAAKVFNVTINNNGAPSDPGQDIAALQAFGDRNG